MTTEIGRVTFVQLAADTEQLIAVTAEWKGRGVSEINETISVLNQQISKVKNGVHQLDWNLEKGAVNRDRMFRAKIALESALDVMKGIEKKVLILDKNSWRLTKWLQKHNPFRSYEKFIEVDNPVHPSMWSSPSVRVDGLCRDRLEEMFRRTKETPPFEPRRLLTSKIGKDGVEKLAELLLKPEVSPVAVKDLLVLEERKQQLEKLAQHFLLKGVTNLSTYLDRALEAKGVPLKENQCVRVTYKEQDTGAYVFYSATARDRVFHRILADKTGFSVFTPAIEGWKETEHWTLAQLQEGLVPGKMFSLSEWQRYTPSPTKTHPPT